MSFLAPFKVKRSKFEVKDFPTFLEIVFFMETRIKGDDQEYFTV